MSSALSIRLLPDELRSLGSGSIGAAYMGIGSAFTQPIRIIHIQNLTDQTLIFSFDGINDHQVLAANGFILLDITANKTREQGYYISEGTRIYAKEESVTPTSGNVYISSFYGKN